MYFWRLERLKEEMAAHPLSEREALPYLIVFVALSAAAAGVPYASFNFWDGLGVAWSVLLAVFGTIYIYRRNGGAVGQHFLQRYFAIGWVIAFRWLVVLLIPLFAVVIVLEVVGLSKDSTSWPDVLFLAVIEGIFYWRIGHHVGDLARRAAGPPPIDEADDGEVPG